MNEIKNKFTKLVNEVLLLVSEGIISPESQLVQTTVEILKILDETNADSSSSSNKHRGKRGSMFNHVMDVSQLILIEKKSFNSAVKLIAKQKEISLSSVHQACCRAQKLKTSDWEKMFKGDSEAKQKIYNSLRDKYFEHKDFISQLFKLA